MILIILMTAGLCVETAKDIMARVAENQNRSQSLRSAYVYHQNVLVRLKRSNGKLAREEMRDYTVAPSADGVQRKLLTVAGKYEKSGKVIEFSGEGFRRKHLDIDGDIAEDLARDFGAGERTHDGVDNEMFPLTEKAQLRYDFELTGTENYKGREVYHIKFTDHEKEWAGDALIDAKEYQPLVVTSHFVFGIPLLVKTMLGTDLEHVGFKVTYQKFEDGVWFPVSYGGELRIRAVFFYARTIAMGVVNSGFERADVQSKVEYDVSTAR